MPAKDSMNNTELLEELERLRQDLAAAAEAELLADALRPLFGDAGAALKEKK